MSARSFQNRPGKEFDFHTIPIVDSPDHDRKDYHPSALVHGDRSNGLRYVGEGVDFSVVGQNLLGPSHEEFGGDPGPLVGLKRSIYGKITWRR